MPGIDEILRERLAPEQALAATDDSRKVLALACAGSGKSRTLAYRIAHLVDARNVEPKAIVAFTFTEKAAETIKRRVADALQAAELDAAMIGAMYIGTMHAFCQRILGEIDARYRQYDVLDGNRLILFLISRYPQLGLHRLRRDRGAMYFDTVREVAKAWMLINDELIDIETVENADPLLGSILRSLQELMRAAQFMDFSQMIRRVVEALRTGEADRSETLRHLEHLLVDEYQDINPAQEELIRRIHDRGASIFVVGDDDQAIYGWRGADVSNILTFQERYQSSRHTLAHNYRSTVAIVQAADAFAAAELGATRLTKNPTATNPDGARDFQRLWFANRQAEAEFVATRIARLLGSEYVERDGTRRGLTPADFAILMRSTRSNESDGQARHAAFTQALSARGIPFSLEAGGGPFERAQVQALLRSFALLRDRSPTREEARAVFNAAVATVFPSADFEAYADVLARWGREIHAPIEETRRRVFPQRLVYELLAAFRVADARLEDGAMRDVALFSRIMQDVEAVYVSIDSATRFNEILNFLENAAETGYDTSTDDLVLRPDTVTVTTVHTAKGLEFPVVLLVDVEQNRFPGTRRSYDGWLPLAVVGAALARGAYQGTREGESRLYYTALTRAERYLYVTGSERLPGGQRAWRPSVFSTRLNHAELRIDGGEPQGLAAAEPRRRVEDSDLPTSFSEIRYYLRCPKDYQYRRRFGFSPPIPELFGFGQTVHTSIGRLHQEYSHRAPTREEAEGLADDTFHLKHIAASRDPIERPGPYERAKNRAVQIVGEYTHSYQADFANGRQVEARFEVPLDGAVISGSIDLLLREDDRGTVIDARVVDFKSIEAGEDALDNEGLDWTELSLQVQLYAMGARVVLGENTRTGSVHFLKDNQRVDVPITEDAVEAAVTNVQWAVGQIMAGDFPMRPHPTKCEACDFKLICQRRREDFTINIIPPPIETPRGPELARAFSEVE